MRLNVLEYAADFIRGWPHGEAVQMNYPSAGAEKFGNGDIVAVNNGTYTSFAAAGAVGADLPFEFAVIARGAKDTFAAGGTGRGNLYTQVVPNIGILSNFVMRTNRVSAANPPVSGEPLGLVQETIYGGAGETVEYSGLVWCAAGASAPVGNHYVVPGATLLEAPVSVNDADGLSASAAVILVK